MTGWDLSELAAGLGALAAGVVSGGVASGLAPADGASRVGFLFAGQGSQRTGMAAGLHAASPVFSAAFDEAAGLPQPEASGEPAGSSTS